jgi:hypothetical protein
VREAHRLAVVVAVAVINRLAGWPMLRHEIKRFWRGFIVLVTVLINTGYAATLPEQRVDVNYHQYSGGGIDVRNPALLVRKSLLDNYSVTAGYQVDQVSGASIDVEARASTYKEERTAVSLGVDYVHEKTMLALGFNQSEENDFDAQSLHLDLRQEFFADMTTVSLGYSQGEDDIAQTGVAEFAEQAKRRHFRVGISQVLSPRWIANLSAETISDEGYLQNPYRAVRYRDLSFPAGFTYQEEIYPRTRTSRAIALRLRQYLEHHAAVHYDLRNYSDSWGIGAVEIDLGYVYPFARSGWELETRIRHYRQSSADFYRDLFDFQDQTNFRARDKELSEFYSTTLGLGVRYSFKLHSWQAVDRAAVNLLYDFMRFTYADFRDVTLNDGRPGEEPTYQFDAHVVRFFVSFWY